RLLHGETLYRDIGSSYGPLPPYLDAAALRFFGEHLDVLIAVRTLFALLGVAALQRLVQRLAGDTLKTAAITSFIVATTFFGFGSPYPFPYSVAALEGTVGLWWALELALGATSWRSSLAAALLAGLAGGAKVELVPVAIAGTALALFWSRPRRQAAACTLLTALVGAASFALPVLWVGPEALRRHGFLIALDSPESWRHFYSWVMFGGPDLRSYVSGGFMLTLFPSLVFLLSALALLAASSSSPLWAGAAAAFAASGAVRIRGNDELHVLIPLAIALAVWELASAARARAFRTPQSPHRAWVCVAVPMLLVVWRQPFFLKIPAYSAFTSPLALAFCLSWLATRPWPRLSRAVPLLAAALCLSQGADRFRESRFNVMRWVSLPRASLYLPIESADLVEATARLLDRTTRIDDYACVFPEPGFITFATRRRSPFIDEQFHAGMQDATAEDEMIQRLKTRRIPVALITNRPLGFDGAEYRRGLLDRFFAEFDRSMRPVALLGDNTRRIPGMGQAAGAVVYVPRSETP
ncbi:MAG: glycosyltransferase family 39 protein, partial [Thermoanaerobaculia bacterium]